MVKRHVLLRWWGIGDAGTRSRGTEDLVTAGIGAVGLSWASVGVLAQVTTWLSNAPESWGWDRIAVGGGLVLLCRPIAKSWRRLNR
ncbi:MAG: hypothetical protein AAF628_26610 [Planctomycetota bacterium]